MLINLTSPKETDFTEYHIYKSYPDQLLMVLNYHEYYTTKISPKMITIKILKKTEYERAIKETDNKKDKIYEMFKKELIADNQLTNHPKAETLFKICEEFGDGIFGFDWELIEIQFNKLAILLKD